MKRYNKKFHKRQERFASHTHGRTPPPLPPVKGSLLDRWRSVLEEMRDKKDDDSMLFDILVEYMESNNFVVTRRFHGSSNTFVVGGRNQDPYAERAQITICGTEVTVTNSKISRKIDLHHPESLEKIAAIASFAIS